MQMRCRGAEVQRCRYGAEEQRWYKGAAEVQVQRCRMQDMIEMQKCRGAEVVNRCCEVVQRRCRGLEVY